MWEIGKSGVNTSNAGYAYLNDVIRDRPTDKSREEYFSRGRTYGNNWSKTLIGTDFQDPNKTLAEKLGSAFAGGVTLLAPVKGASAVKGTSAAGRLETGAARAQAGAAAHTIETLTPSSRTTPPVPHSIPSGVPTLTTSKPAAAALSDTAAPTKPAPPVAASTGEATTPIKPAAPTPGPNYKPFTITPAPDTATAATVRAPDIPKTAVDTAAIPEKLGADTGKTGEGLGATDKTFAAKPAAEKAGAGTANTVEVPARVKSELLEPKEMVPATAAEIADRNWLISTREQAIATRDREALTRVGVSPSELRGARSTINNVGEALGTLAGRDAVAHYFPSAKFDVRYLLPDDLQGSGVFDQVALVTERGTGRTQTIVLENKGPTAKLGYRRGEAGLSFHQGTRGYLNSILDTMKRSGDPDRAAVASEIRKSLRRSEVEYWGVRSKLDKDGQYTGFERTRFKI
ncbi:hypothetical protein [Tsukamurella tyrosinosolvens]|uniref:hypothetical protein n=1 Tax=Tsukamurella tyrosinosolvens TaxID=57704 RepID=UPI0015F1567B|nr:hypothetical protein [Tsukamurella tyrosinosolvens]